MHAHTDYGHVIWTSGIRVHEHANLRWSIVPSPAEQGAFYESSDGILIECKSVCARGDSADFALCCSCHVQGLEHEPGNVLVLAANPWWEHRVVVSTPHALVSALASRTFQRCFDHEAHVLSRSCVRELLEFREKVELAVGRGGYAYLPGIAHGHNRHYNVQVPHGIPKAQFFADN